MYGLVRNILVSLIHVPTLPIFPLYPISFLTIGKQNAASVNAKRYSIHIGLDRIVSISAPQGGNGQAPKGLRRLTPARLTRYKTVPAISSSFPALLAGTLSKRALKRLPSSPTGFMLLGTTVSIRNWVHLCGLLQRPVSLTTWVNSHHSYIEAAELCCQQLD